MAMSIDWYQYLLEEFKLTIIEFWDKEKREEVKTDFEKKFSWMDEDPVLREEIYPKISEGILSVFYKSVEEFDVNDFKEKIQFLETGRLPGIVELEYKKLFTRIKAEQKTLEDIDKSLKNCKSDYLDELQEYGKKRVESLQTFFQSLDRELQKFSKEKRGFLSIYACGKELEQLISEETVRLYKEKIGETGVQTYFCKLVGTKDPIQISSRLIKLLKPIMISKSIFKDELLINFADKWRKDKKEACGILVNKLCQLDELKGMGRSLHEQLNHVLLQILPEEPDFQTVKSILSLMLCKGGILELEVFRKMVDSGIPSIPKLEVMDGDQKLGECDVFAMMEKNRFIGLEVTLRRELEDKRRKLHALQDVLTSKGLNFDYRILADERAGDLGDDVIELTEFDVKKLLKI
jgi:hypothetical protein